MEEQKQPIKIPVYLIILDVIGMISIGLGAAELSGNIQFFAEILPFEYYHWGMIVVGALLTVPFIIHLVKTALESKGQF